MKPLYQILAHATTVEVVPLRACDRDAPSKGEMPRFATGVRQLDDMLGGGLYGLAAVGGPAKSGKSLMATRAAVEAALSGWRVMYCYGEGSDALLMRRVNGVLGCKDHTEWPAEFVDNWSEIHFDVGQSITSICARICDRLDGSTDRVLIVIDSFNRLARRMSAMSERGDAYYKAMEKISRIGQVASEASNGRIAFLVLSELNRNGRMSGIEVEYAATCLIFISPDAEKYDQVSISLEARESASGKLGNFYRVPAACRFLSTIGPTPRRVETPVTSGFPPLTLVEGEPPF